MYPVLLFLQNVILRHLTAAAAAAAKSLQSCPALCNPMDYSPSGSPVHGILQARILEWIALPFSSPILEWMKLNSKGGTQKYVL